MRLLPLALSLSLVVFAGCVPGPALRFEGARPETATVLAGSVTMGAAYESESDDSSDYDYGPGDTWGYAPPNVTFAAWWRWALGGRVELSTGTDIDLGYKNAASVGGGAKFLLTPPDGSDVHLAVSAAGGLTLFVYPGVALAAWVDGGLPLTFDLTSTTALTFRPSVRYGTPLTGWPDDQHYLFAGGSLAVRHPCGEGVACVYELGVLALVHPLDDGSSQGLLDASFGVGAVF